MRLVPAAALLLTGGLLVGCAPPGSEDGDCNMRVEYEGTIYRPHNALNQEAPAGGALGNGDLLGCDRETVGHEAVFAVEGVDPSVAVLVKAEGHGVYVAEDVPRSEWPTALQQP